MAKHTMHMQLSSTAFSYSDHLGNPLPPIHPGMLTAIQYSNSYNLLKYAITYILQVNESKDIHIPDCTNIDLSQLEEIYLRLDVYDILNQTTSVMQEQVKKHRDDCHYCTWIHNRINDNDNKDILYETLCKDSYVPRDMHCNP